MGQIEVICGPMFSGKTEELIRRLRRAAIARRKVQVFKPHLDTRYDPEAVVSHSQQRIISSPDQVHVGAGDAYEPRCRKDFSPEPRPAGAPPLQELLPFLRG